MWDSNPRSILWISWILVVCNSGYSQKIVDDTDGLQSTIDFLANDASVIALQSRNGKSANLQYERPKDQEITTNYESDEMIPMDTANGTQSRIGLSFLFGDRNPFSFLGRPTRRIPTVENDRRNGLSQEYQGNPFLFTTNNNNFGQQTTSKRPNNKQSQWQSIQQEFDPQPQLSNGASGWNSNSNTFNSNPFQNNNAQVFPQNQQNWQTTSRPNNWQQPSNWNSNNPSSNNNWQQPTPNGNKPVNSNTMWQQNSNSWQNPSSNWQQTNEDRPTWGSSSQSWTTKPPKSNWQQTSKTTTKRADTWWGGGGNDQDPVWTEKTTTSGRYRPSPTKKPHRKSISELKCEEYSKPYTQTINALPLSLDPELLSINVGKCDRNAQALIVGGQKSELGEFPHMAAVGFKTGRGLSWNCGGSLISEYYVLTAAHCTDSSLGKPVAVRCGELNLVRNDDGASPKNYKVVQVIAHPDYRSNKKYNDIALLRLDQAVDFTNAIRPACLHTTDSIAESRAIATGWGSLGFGDRSSDVLLKVGLNFIDNRKCASLYRAEHSGSLNKGIVDTQLCAGDLQGGYDTCLGDSGGPLQVTSNENKCIYKIVGITSFGKFCGERNSPGVYTRVSNFVPWIESIVWP